MEHWTAASRGRRPESARPARTLLEQMIRDERGETYEEFVRYAEDFARREGCRYVALACGREREGALRFYERRGYERPGYSMRKNLH